MKHVSKLPLLHFNDPVMKLTISTFLETVKERRVHTIVRSVPHVVVGVVALPGPLEEDLGEHVCVHRDDDEP